ncbi:MAG TPA: SHOCT domain-containing protein [Herpetosiphonaceae bacterium]
MNLTDEITRLHRLRQDGALTAAEFEQAKAALLNQASAPQFAAASGHEYFQGDASSRFHDELSRVDREWMMEREKYMIRGKHGSRSEPGGAGAIFGSVFFIGFAVFWMLMASRAGGSFWMFGLLFVAVGIISGISHMIKLQGYRQAEARYQQRRAEVLARHGQASYPQIQPDYPLYR